MAAPRKPEVQEALRLIAEEKMHPYAAAKQAGANRFSVYSALRAQKEGKVVAPAAPVAAEAAEDVTTAAGNAALRTIRKDFTKAGEGRRKSIAAEFRSIMAIAEVK